MNEQLEGQKKREKEGQIERDDYPHNMADKLAAINHLRLCSGTVVLSIIKPQRNKFSILGD